MPQQGGFPALAVAVRDGAATGDRFWRQSALICSVRTGQLNVCLYR
jgi:hypothetical protein